MLKFLENEIPDAYCGLWPGHIIMVWSKLLLMIVTAPANQKTIFIHEWYLNNENRVMFCWEWDDLAEYVCHSSSIFPSVNVLICAFIVSLLDINYLHCFDAWVSGRASGLWKTEWWGAGVVICLERGADLHIAQLMPLPLTLSSSVKSRLVLPFWYRLTPGSPGKRAVKRVCVCVAWYKKVH